MFEEMRAALRSSQERGFGGGHNAAAQAGRCDDSTPAGEWRSVSLTPATVLRMATLDGARALGWDHLVGSLEVGKRADMVVVRLPEEEADPTVVLVEGATAADVQLTLVDGIVAYEGRESPIDVVRGRDAVRTRLGLRD
jgi:cytosine/adenosine deaminase-related metal-dependent hydrolase